MLKRSLDIVLSALALLVLMPLLLPICLILRFSGEGYVFYRQARIGRKGRTFGLIKFATMLKDSPNIGSGEITLKNDPRVLPIGRFLRKTKINELPQLINVLLGDMSIIGPRPVTASHFGCYSKEHQEIIGSMRPGLSGIGSIIFRDEESIYARFQNMEAFDIYRNLIAPYKCQLELWYAENRNMLLDLKLIFLTFWVVFFKHSKLAYTWIKDLPQAGSPQIFSAEVERAA